MMIASRYTKPIPREEEFSLLQKAKAGDIDATQRLVLANYRFVVSICLTHQNRGVEMEDLINEGCMGLQRAVKSYNMSSGLKLISYAVWWIRAYIGKAIIEQGGLYRLPNNYHHRAKGMTEEELQENRRAITNSRSNPSLDAMMVAGRDFVHMGPKPDQIAEERIYGEMLESLLSGLKPDDADILRARFGIETGENQTLRQIGDTMNLSYERVRQREESAMKKLNKAAKLKGLSLAIL